MAVHIDTNANQEPRQETGNEVQKILLKQLERLQQESEKPGQSAEQIMQISVVMASLAAPLATLAAGSQSTGEVLKGYSTRVTLSVDDLADLYAGRALRQRRSQGEARRTE